MLLFDPPVWTYKFPSGQKKLSICVLYVLSNNQTHHHYCFDSRAQRVMLRFWLDFRIGLALTSLPLTCLFHYFKSTNNKPNLFRYWLNNQNRPTTLVEDQSTTVITTVNQQGGGELISSQAN